MFNDSQDLHADNGSKAMQARGNLIDKSTTNNYYGLSDKEEKKDFGIIEEIFKYLFEGANGEMDYAESSNGKGLKKIPLNFSGDSFSTVNEMALKTIKKRDLVKKFVNVQREIDESKIDALVLKLQKDFRSLKNSENSYEKIESIKILEQMSENCIEKSNRENPDYYMNALSIVLYFFEMCDFGKSEEARAIQESIF